MRQINPEDYNEEWLTFLKRLREYERKLLLKKKEDEFLDLYSRWLKTRNREAKNRLLPLIKELHRLEPGLKFANLLMKLEKIEI